MSDAPKPNGVAKLTLPPTVPVELNDKVVTDDEFTEAMKRKGLVLRAKDVHDLETIGVHVRGRGVLKIQAGQTIVLQSQLNAAMDVISESFQASVQTVGGKRKLPSSEKILELSKAMTLIAGKLVDSQHAAVQIERARTSGGQVIPPEAPDAPLNRTFSAGGKIVPATAINVEKGGHVHVHTSDGEQSG